MFFTTALAVQGKHLNELEHTLSRLVSGVQLMLEQQQDLALHTNQGSVSESGFSENFEFINLSQLLW